MDNRVDIVDREICHDRFFRLERYRLRHSLFAGGMSEVLARELLIRGRAGALLPYDWRRDEVVLIEQFRIGALHAPSGAWLLETVAGVEEEGESIEELVIREAREEAGCEISAVVPVYEFFPMPGGSSERIALHIGCVDTATVEPGSVHGVAEEGEDIRVHVMKRDEAMRRIETGEIDSSYTIIALLWLASNRDKVRAAWEVARGGKR